MRVAGRGAQIHDHGELVAPHSGRDAAAADHRLEAVRNLLEQLVPGAVAERVVDGLEAVEVDDQQGEAAKSGRLLDGGREPLLQHVPVGKSGERVVIGAVAELVLQARELGDVLVRRDPSAVAERLMDHRYDAARIEVEHGRRVFVLARKLDAPGHVLIGVVADRRSALDPPAEDRLEARAVAAEPLGQVVEFEELLVAVDQLLVAVEHRDGEPGAVDRPWMRMRLSRALRRVDCSVDITSRPSASRSSSPPGPVARPTIPANALCTLGPAHRANLGRLPRRQT